VRRLRPIACALCACLAWVPETRAQDDSKRACASAFTSAQRLMRTGNLLEAKKRLVLCGGPECPKAMHPDCQQWLSSVEASIPTVVFQVSSTTGGQPETVQLSVDGEDATILDGRAVSMDPGAHDVAFVTQGFRPASRHIVVSEGEKLRREVVPLAPLPVKKATDSATLPALSAPAGGRAVERPASRVTVPVILASSGAALAGVGAIYFGLQARSDDRNLAGCSPNCGRDGVDYVKREYLWANLSIGLAVAGITTAAVLFVINGRSSRAATMALGLNAGPEELGLTATGTF